MHHLGTDADAGLPGAEARLRLRQFGANRLEKERQVTVWTVAVEEVTEPMILLLIAVAVLYGLWGDVRDAIAIFLIITGISVVEILNEYRAKAAIASLHRLASPVAPVVRDGARMAIDAADLVPGDVVMLGPGERVAADLRIVEASALRLDESSLTGESVPVAKRAAALPVETPLADRHNMAYATSLVTSGKGLGVVVETGMATEIGRIAGLVKTAREPRTPLQLAMRQLAGYLVWVALALSVVVPVLGLLLAGQPLQEMILTGLTLAFATIPEELPILITVVLGLGSLRLSKRNAVVKRLRAAETLGSVSVVATDKTGTITENRMALAEVWVPGRADGGGGDGSERRVLELGVLAGETVTAGAGGGFAGDPTDVAVLEGAASRGIDRAALRGAGPLVEFTFDDDRRLMSAVYRRDGLHLVTAKGAPESIINRCEEQLVGGCRRSMDEESRSAALSAADAMARRGLRVIGVAEREMHPSQGDDGLAGTGAPSRDQYETRLSLAGLIGLADPPRPEASRALSDLGGAGVRVIMLTGDHAATAAAVAGLVGIPNETVVAGTQVDAMNDGELREAAGRTSIFARIAPEHKLRIVEALQARGETVAVTGDGVNDAPALKAAAIGVTMGRTGTDVAREAADMVLADDNFATIAAAVREGRKLFENLRKAVRYYLAVKVALVSVSLLAVLLRMPVPFSPIQIIVTELFMDLGASVAFTSERAEGDVMQRPPRNAKRPFMDGPMQAGILAGGVSLGAAVLFAYLWATSRGGGAAHAQGVAFATWMVGHVLLALHMRSERQPLLSLGVLSNPAMAIWGIGAVGLAFLGSSVPLVADTLRLGALSPGEWALAVTAPLISTGWWEVWKLARWRER